MAILILTNQDDPHADAIVHQLTQRKAKVVRLDPVDFPGQAIITARRLGESWSYHFQNSRHEIDLNEVKSIWVRRPTAWSYSRIDVDDTEVGQFVQAERRDVLGGLWDSLTPLWVNHPSLDRTAGQKLYQLKLASELGLRVPDTLVTNDPTEVARFYEACEGNVIYKTFTRGYFRSVNQMVYTSPVTQEHLEQIQRIQNCPCLFQENIPKAFEVRTTIVGQEVLSAAIYSQEHERTRQDWRRSYSEDIEYKQYDLPADVQTLLLKMVSRLGLNFGAIDLIVTPEGEHVFLEINPSGQFGFIEVRTGLPISAALVDLLIRGKP